uniref:protein moonraker-like isoform X1 n=1 Tax=Styela clava TaxID=7725 RepID=UPI00193AC026|nr:protein moonraker-like isoform X1 [Styela clava]
MLHANQLQFNLDVPVDPENLQTDFASPSAIIFERILPAGHRPSKRVHQKRSGSPIRLSVLSNDRLSKALQLAKQDLKSARRRKAVQAFAKENELYISTDSEKDANVNSKPKKGVNLPLSSNHTQTHKKKTVPKGRKQSPNRQLNGISVSKPSKYEQEMLDIKRLRLDLRQHIFSMDKNMQDRDVLFQQKLLSLDQEEEQRLIVRHLEQMRKSSRTVYALQQQVQIVKEDLSRSNKADRTPNVKKERIYSRLAAVHRGTVRLMQVYCTQIPEHLMFDDNFVAINALYQEVSRLIKELSLCSLQLDLANIEEVEKISDLLKDMEPKYIPKPASPKLDHRLKSSAKQTKTPQRSFKSKEVIMVKKSYVQPKQSRNTHMRSPHKQRTPSKVIQQPNRAMDSTRPQMTDIFDRSEWIPPPNSPYKEVGPPPLTPLLESPAPSKGFRSHPIKQVKFHSTPRGSSIEHDIDTHSVESPRDLRTLKNKLASELEMELRNRINPLLQKVSVIVEKLAKSANKDTPKVQRKTAEEANLESQVRDIIDETRKEMKNFYRQQEVEKEAVDLYQGPSIESLLMRLDTIGKEEEAIRRRWQEINYLDMKPEDHTPSTYVRDSAPTSPQPSNFTKTLTSTASDPPKRIVNFLPQEDSAEIRHEPTVRHLQRELATNKSRPFTGRTLILPVSTINAVNRCKQQYERHLKFTFHEPKGNFDPWKLVEELSDKVLDEVITSVTHEVNGMCEVYANDMFQREFANASQSNESSLLMSDNSSSLLSSESTLHKP